MAGCIYLVAVGVAHQSLLMGKALPEWDFRYVSKDRVVVRPLKARSVNHNRFLAKARPD